MEGGGVLSFLELGEAFLLSVVEGLGAGLALFLESLDELALRPAYFLREVVEHAEAAMGHQTEHSQSFGNDLALLSVVGRGHAFEAAEPSHGGLAALGFARDHAADDAEEHVGGGALVVGSAGGVGVHALVDVVLEFEVVAEERAGDVDLLAAHDHDLLAGEELLRDDGGEAAEEVTSPVDDHLLVEHLYFLLP